MDLDCIEDIIELMIQNYDICYEDKMSPSTYKKLILKGVDKRFEKCYNKYKENEREID